MPKRKVPTVDKPVFRIAPEDEIRRRPIFKIATTLCLGALFLLILVAKLDRIYGRDLLELNRNHDKATHVTSSHTALPRDAFDEALQQMPFVDPSTAVGTAKSLCTWFNQTGQPFRTGVEHLLQESPTWSQEQATAFAIASATKFCPGVVK